MRNSVKNRSGISFEYSTRNFVGNSRKKLEKFCKNSGKCFGRKLRRNFASDLRRTPVRDFEINIEKQFGEKSEENPKETPGKSKQEIL